MSVEFNSYCSVALLVTVVLQVLALRFSFTRIVFTLWYKSFSGKGKRNNSQPALSGPFVAAKPLTTIPEHTYFIESSHREYQPPSGFLDFYNYQQTMDRNLGWVGGIMLITPFGLVWWSVYSTIQNLEQLLNQHQENLSFLPQLLAFITLMFIFSSVLMEKWRYERQCLQQIKHGTPYAGTVLKATKETERSDDPHRRAFYEVYKVQYAFTTSSGKQVIGSIKFEPELGQSQPKPGDSLVVMYVKEDCHMPL